MPHSISSVCYVTENKIVVFFQMKITSKQFRYPPTTIIGILHQSALINTAAFHASLFRWLLLQVLNLFMDKIFIISHDWTTWSSVLKLMWCWLNQWIWAFACTSSPTRGRHLSTSNVWHYKFPASEVHLSRPCMIDKTSPSLQTELKCFTRRTEAPWNSRHLPPSRSG